MKFKIGLIVGLLAISQVVHADRNVNAEVVTITNGACGISDGQVFDQAPAQGFCASGNFEGIKGIGPWGWMCSGIDPGNNASCVTAVNHQVSVGYVHTCSVDKSGVRCWGDTESGDYGQIDVPGDLINPFQVAAGGYRSCALDDTGVVCWGYSHSNDIPIPENLSNPIQLSMDSGGGSACVLDDHGVKCWGYPRSYQLPGLSNPIDISVGGRHTCAIDDTGVVCAGSNGHGQTDVPSGLVNPTRVSVGEYHTCAVDDNGVKCWGGFQPGILAALNFGSIVPDQISSGYESTCVIHDGRMTCRGYPEYYPFNKEYGEDNGQLFFPQDLSNPKSISLGNINALYQSCVVDDGGVRCWSAEGLYKHHTTNILSNPTRISAGYSHTCALDDNGVTCWEYDIYGESTAPANLSNPTQISVNGPHTCTVDDNGVRCWGNNDFGQADVPGNLVNPTLVAVGGVHTCALDDNGVHCWGDNGRGQLNIPPDLSNPTQLSAGFDSSCSIDDSGVHCWGGNGDHLLVPDNLVNPVQVSTGYNHACALDDDGVHCWGSGDKGQTSVPRLFNPRQISVGYEHSCALDDYGVSCWGSYRDDMAWSDGGLNIFDRTIPTRLLNPRQIASGAYHTCVLDDHGVTCWGKRKWQESFLTQSVSQSCFLPDDDCYKPAIVRIDGPAYTSSLDAVITLGVSVTGNYPTGYISIKDDGVGVPGCRLLVLDRQTTQCEFINDLSGGEHIFTAEYSGDYYNLPASASFTMTVDKLPVPSLSVFKRGSGSGRVTSGFGYIDCGDNCSVGFPAGSTNFVTMDASPEPGSTFIGWESAECSGNGSCTIEVDSGKGVNAVFTDDSLTDFAKPVGSCNGITGHYANRTISNESIVCIADTQTNLGENLTVRNQSSIRMEAPVNIISAPFSMVDSTLSVVSTPPLPEGSNNPVIAPTGNPGNPFMLVKHDGTQILFHYSAFDEKYTGYTLKSPQGDVLQVKLWPDGHLKYLYFNGYVFAVSKIVDGLVDVLASAPDGTAELFTDIPITPNLTSSISSFSKVQSVVVRKSKATEACDEDPDGSLCELEKYFEGLKETYIVPILTSLTGVWDEVVRKALKAVKNIDEFLDKFKPAEDIGTPVDVGEILEGSDNCEPGITREQCFYNKTDDQEDRQDAIDWSVTDRMEKNQALLADSDKFDVDDYSGGRPVIVILNPADNNQEVPAGRTLKVRINVSDHTGITKLIFRCPKEEDLLSNNNNSVTSVAISPPRKTVDTSFLCKMPEFDQNTNNAQIWNVGVEALNVSNETESLYRSVILKKPETDVEVSLTSFRSDTLEKDGSKAGEFEFARSGTLESDLRVFFSISGTATSGDDYTGIISQVTIPKGQKTAKIYVHARTDSIDDPNETVTLSLNSVQEDGVTIAAASKATVTIIQETVACNSLQQEGGDSSNSRTIDLGVSGRDFVFSWEAQTIKDSFSLSFGSGSFTTGCISGSGSKTINSGSSQYVTVTVAPNCEATTGTAWSYSLSCP